MSSLLGIILANFRSKLWGQYRQKYIAPAILESKIGSKEPQNRLTSGLWAVSKSAYDGEILKKDSFCFCKNQPDRSVGLRWSVRWIPAYQKEYWDHLDSLH